jgi:hypothetical protein
MATTRKQHTRTVKNVSKYGTNLGTKKVTVKKTTVKKPKK